METLLTFLGMALVTYLTRYTMMAALDRELPLSLKRWLRHVPTAVLSAMVAPALLTRGQELALGHHTLAVLTGAAVAWRTRRVLPTILAGMATYWLLQIVL